MDSINDNPRFARVCQRIARWSLATFCISVSLFLAAIFVVAPLSEYGAILAIPNLLMIFLSAIAHSWALLARNVFTNGCNLGEGEIRLNGNAKLARRKSRERYDEVTGRKSRKNPDAFPAIYSIENYKKNIPEATPKAKRTQITRRVLAVGLENDGSYTLKMKRQAKRQPDSK